MNTRQKVLILASFAPSLVKFRGRLIEAMIAQGHSVIAAAPLMDGKTAIELRRSGAEVREIPIRNASLKPADFVASLKAVRALIRDVKPDVVLSYTIKPVILGSLAASLEGVRTIVSLITGVGYAFTGGRELKRLISRAAASVLYRLALSRSTVVIFQNPDDEALFRRLRLVRRRQATTIVNGSGVDIDYYHPVPLPQRAAFLMIARLLKDKGIREFATAAARLKALHPEVEISLVGPFDPSPDSLSPEDLKGMIGCGIDYKGALDDVRPAIANCSVYVLPSYREGTPRSVLEAMAMARAIVTTDAPGCRETVKEGQNGFLVQPRNSDALFDAMAQFVHDPSLAEKMGKRSRVLAEERFNVADVNTKILRCCGLDA